MVDALWLKGPLNGIRDLIASSTTFQTIVGAGSETAAKAFVHPWEAYDEDLEDETPTAPRPRVLLAYDDNYTVKRSTTGWGSGYIVRAEFELVPDADDTTDEAYTWFMDKMQLIVNEMQANEGTGYIIVEHMETVGCPQIADPDRNNGERFIWMGVLFMKESK